MPISLFSGWYQFVVVRGVADVLDIVLLGTHFDGSNVVLSPVPQFVPALVTDRRVIVPRAMLTVSVITTFFTPGSVSVFYDLNHPGRNASVIAPLVVSLIPTDFFVMEPVNNSLTVSSSEDGDFNFVLQMDPSDILGVVMMSQTQDGIMATITPVPAFQQGVVQIPMVWTVSYRVQRVFVTPTFLTPNSVLLSRYPLNAPWDLDQASNSSFLATDTQIIGMELVVGINTLSLFSLIDGPYQYQIERLPPDIVDVVLTIDQQYGGVDQTASQVWVTQPAAFDVHTFRYTTSVNHVTDIVHVMLTVVTPSVYTVLYEHPLLNLSYPIFTTQSRTNFTLLEGLSLITVLSATDGRFIYEINRLPADVQPWELPLLLDVNSAVLPTGTAITPLQMTPPADPTLIMGHPVFQLNISYTVHALQWMFTFLEARPNTVVINEGLVTSVPISAAFHLTSAVLSLPFATVAVRDYTYCVTSRLDGLYFFRITRLPVDLQSMVVLATSENGLNQQVITLTPPWQPEIFEYATSVPFVVFSVEVRFFHLRPDAGYFVDNENLGQSLPPSLVNAPQPGNQLMSVITNVGVVPGQNNTLLLNSLLDGVYTLFVTRDLASIQSVVFTATLLSGGALMAQSVPLPTSQLLADTRILPESAVFGSVSSAFTLAVPYIVSQLTPTLVVSFAVLADAVRDVQLGSAIERISALNSLSQSVMTDTGADTAGSFVESGTPGVSYSLQCGLNVIRAVSCLDGQYQCGELLQ